MYTLGKSEQQRHRGDGTPLFMANHGAAIDRTVRNWGALGGVFILIAAAVWFVIGLAVGIVFIYPFILALFGIIVIYGAISTARRKKRLAERRSNRKEKGTE
jgi:fatty acid desaturase